MKFYSCKRSIQLNTIRLSSFVRRSFSSSKNVTVPNSQRQVGFIGLGNMGGHMCSNILNKCNSHTLQVYDIVPENISNLVKLGANADYQSVQDLAKNCDIIITMLPATDDVKSLLTGPNGLLHMAKKGTLFIDSSTIDPIASKELNAQAHAMGMKMIDAPVSGGVTGAEAGTLTFMVGGLSQDIDLARPVLNSMGKNIIHCGPAGAGGIAKLCNNLALAISMIGTSEALSLGIQLGMDPKTLSAVMNTSTARCWSSEMYNPVPGVMSGVPSSRDYSGGFGSKLMEKDLSLALDLSRVVKTLLPLGSSALQLYRLLNQQSGGYKHKDFSVIYEFLSKQTKE